MKTNKNKIYNLTTKETLKLFVSKDMANWNCNVEFTRPTNSGGSNKGRKTGSKNKMTLAKLAAEVDSIKMTVSKLANIVEQLAQKMDEGFARQEKFNKLILSRIDNLVVKNNLKE